MKVRGNHNARHLVLRRQRHLESTWLMAIEASPRRHRLCMNRTHSSPDARDTDQRTNANALWQLPNGNVVDIPLTLSYTPVACRVSLHALSTRERRSSPMASTQPKWTKTSRTLAVGNDTQPDVTEHGVRNSPVGITAPRKASSKMG